MIFVFSCLFSLVGIQTGKLQPFQKAGLEICLLRKIQRMTEF